MKRSARRRAERGASARAVGALGAGYFGRLADRAGDDPRARGAGERAATARRASILADEGHSCRSRNFEYEGSLVRAGAARPAHRRRDGLGEGGVLERPGGVFIRRADTCRRSDIALLRATARIHVFCDGVGLGEIVAANVLSHTRASLRSRRVGARPLQTRAVAARRAAALAAIDASRTDMAG